MLTKLEAAGTEIDAARKALLRKLAVEVDYGGAGMPGWASVVGRYNELLEVVSAGGVDWDDEFASLDSGAALPHATETR